MSARILVVEDDSQQRRYLSAALQANGHEVECLESGDRVVATLQGSIPVFDLVLLDLQMPGTDGIAVLHEMRKQALRQPVLVLTSDGSVSRAVEAMRSGASDFLIKPAGPERLEVSIRNALAMSELSSEVRRLSKVEENRLSFEELVAVAASTRESIAMARRGARSDIPVLIEGESGSGKEIFARAIHGSSERAGAPFIAVNCGALPSQLVESSCSAMKRGRSQARPQNAQAGSRRLMAARCSSTRWASCRWRRRSSCSARYRRARSIRSVQPSP